MEKLIPEYIDPFRYAEQGLHLDGGLKVAEMQRLQSCLTEGMHTVIVNLHFGVDDQGITYLNGHLMARLQLPCQRCMEPFVCEIISDFTLGIVNSLEEANALPEHYEPAITKDSHLALRELIEDEVILNLPLIPRHEPEACKVKLPLQDAGWQKTEKDNPFHVLKSLKQKY